MTLSREALSIDDVASAKRLQPPPVPFAIEAFGVGLIDADPEAASAFDSQTAFATEPVKLSDDFRRCANSLLPEGTPGIGRGAIVVAMFAEMISRLTGEVEFDLAISNAHLATDERGLEDSRVGYLPWRFVGTPDEALEMTTRRFSKEIGDTISRLLSSDNSAYHANRPASSGSSPTNHHVPSSSVSTAALPISAFIAHGSDAKPEASSFEVSLFVQSDLSGCLLQYDRRILAEKDAKRMARLLRAFLDNIAEVASADSSVALSRVPLLTTAERRALQHAWTASKRHYRANATVHQLIIERATTDPSAPAVEYDGSVLNFGDLISRANQVADSLTPLGVGEDVIVGLFADRTPEMVVGLLGILIAGGAYLPIDPEYPPDRVRFMLQDASVKIVLTQSWLASRLEEFEGKVILLDERDIAHEYPDLPNMAGLTSTPPRPAHSRSLAYVIYTSGSTGRPKGVMVEHRGVVNYLSWCIPAYDLETAGGAPVHSSISFDLTVTSLLAPLAAGSRVVLAPETLGAEALADALKSHDDFALVKLTPSHLDLLSHQIPPAVAGGRTRRFVVGGEALHGASLEFWAKHAPDTRIVNEYGPTETVVGCCVYEACPNDALSADVPIGFAIANTRLYVLDRGLQHLPAGVAGELYIGGDGVARGYLGRPELTAERFLQDPYADAPGERMYRTGDRVRARKDGCLEFLGRFDDQVKIRGHRIELGEIEAVLASFPSVAECAVVVREVSQGDQRLVAYYVVSKDSVHQMSANAVDEGVLRRFLVERLPSYMIPSSFVSLTKLPLTRNGKVDRKRLPEQALAREGEVQSVTPPRKALEHMLAGVWAEVLNIPLSTIGVESTFFELGGHSLLAVRMIARVEELLHRRLPLTALLVHPSLGAFAEAIDASVVVEDPLAVRIREGSKEVPPLFYFHGSFNSGGYYCHQLARELDPSQPVFILRPFRAGGPVTMEAMAAQAADALRDINPDGPYHLGGLCNGATLAFEVARVLRAEGKTVGLLAMVNTTDRNPGLQLLRRISSFLHRSRSPGSEAEVEFFRRVRSYGVKIRHTWLRARSTSDSRLGAVGAAVGLTLSRVARALGGRPHEEEISNASLSAESSATAEACSTVDELPAYHHEELYISRATESYAPAPFDGRVDLVFWEDSDALRDSESLHGDDMTRGWGRVAELVNIRVIEGENRTEQLRDAGKLGRLLAELLAEANERIS